MQDWKSFDQIKFREIYNSKVTGQYPISTAKAGPNGLIQERRKKHAFAWMGSWGSMT